MASVIVGIVVLTVAGLCLRFAAALARWTIDESKHRERYDGSLLNPDRIRREIDMWSTPEALRWRLLMVRIGAVVGIVVGAGLIVSGLGG